MLILFLLLYSVASGIQPICMKMIKKKQEIKNKMNKCSITSLCWMMSMFTLPTQQNGA